MHKERKELIARRVKQIRQIANELSLKKLDMLDYGDVWLIFEALTNIYERLYRVKVIADSGCSQLVELLESCGGDVSAPK